MNILNFTNFPHRLISDNKLLLKDKEEAEAKLQNIQSNKPSEEALAEYVLLF